MANILLLYDLEEKDLARDFRDLLKEVNIGPIIMIPLSPSRGIALEEKEKHYFDSANGALFIVTPGSERLGSLYPSPSVAHEMGQAKQKFQEKPECVIYLVDEDCKVPTIDQKAYIPFNRKDIRSIITALTQLIKDLKIAGLFRTSPMPTQVKSPLKKSDLEGLSIKISDQIRQVLFDMSNKENGVISDRELTELLAQKYNLNTREVNFIKRDLVSFEITIHRTAIRPHVNFWQLNDLGWAIVKQLGEERKKREQEDMSRLRALLERARREESK